MFNKIMNGLLVCILFILIFGFQRDNNLESLQVHSEYSPLSVAGQITSITPDKAGSSVILVASSGKTIWYKTNNGVNVDQAPSEAYRIPHLVLNRNAQPTLPEERTLLVSITGLKIPADGVSVSLKIETQHSDPDMGNGAEKRIVVWETTRWVLSGHGDDQTSNSIDFRIEFERTITSQGGTILTPTDYYRYEISLSDRSGKLLGSFSSDFAFLLENQWLATLPQVLEEAHGAAPDNLVIYYCDMFPFQATKNDLSRRLTRDQIEPFIRDILAPAMLEAFRTQSNDWGFIWYPEWVNSRADEDPSLLSVALTEFGTWFHGWAPIRGHSAISIRVDGGMFAYENLADSILSTFHHELFHNHQRNLSLHFGSSSDIAGKDSSWKLFSEGTAVLATVVGQPEVELVKNGGKSAYYLDKLSAFIGKEGFSGNDLNESYSEFSPYNFAVYWRFLYERCGGINQEGEDPASGMLVIRNTLEVLYSADIVDISNSKALVPTLPDLMDKVFDATPKCPFRSHEDSQVMFARAIYGLTLEGGRCGDSATWNDCGFYDPNHVYPIPPVEAVHFTPASRIAIKGKIPTSFGIDFIEVSLSSLIESNSLVVDFRAAPGSEADFKVELIQIDTSITGTGDRLVFRPTYDPMITRNLWDGSFSYTIMDLDRSSMDRLGIIVTRVDVQEDRDSTGNYKISVSSK
ncbi:MAG: hypothetical protein U9R58_11595 [Chloroflexota bacterium]|nr:hypothetical protein [Chloroflexota bacterium]